MKTNLSLNKAYQFGQAIHSINQVQPRLNAVVVQKMAMNLNRINDAFPDVQTEEAKLFEKHGQPKESDENYKGYLTDKIEYHKSTRIEVDIEMIDYNDLNIGTSDRQNHFPPAVVAALALMINGFGEAQ